MTMGQMNKQRALWWSESHGDYPEWTLNDNGTDEQAKSTVVVRKPL